MRSLTKQRWFLVKNPDALLLRRDAVSLIHRHADKVRVFEDLEGHPALLVAENHVRKLVLLAELSDAQIHDELPEAWRREHHQRDLFRDAPLGVANDEHHPSTPRVLRFIQHIWRRYLRD